MNVSNSLPPAKRPKRETEDGYISEPLAARAQNKAKQAPLHQEYSAPLSFLQDAVRAAQSNTSFNLTKIGEPFGLAGEAYARQCYEDIVQSIHEVLLRSAAAAGSENKKHLFVIRGSSGVGKSTFLAYCLARLRLNFGHGTIVLCHAPKSVQSNEIERAICQVWNKGKLLLSGTFRQVQMELNTHVLTAALIIMDGCSLPINLEGCKAMILMAAPPTLYIKNMEDAVMINRRKSFTVPAVSDKEAFGIAALIGVEQDIVETNLLHMGGITRHLFEPGAAKRKVQDAVTQVDAFAISRMVSMQVWNNNKATDLSMVHALVLWKVETVNGKGYDRDPRFELVSRYAERLVAEKLAKESAEKLHAARQSMLAPLSGAQGYAGALFEAYAVRTLLAGGTFTLQSLLDKTRSLSLHVPRIETPVVVETNELMTTSKIVPSSMVRVANGKGGFSATLLWPVTTTSSPTFDCFYFHTDGTMYCLYMTIAGAAVVHDLENSGAHNAAKTYFDKVLVGSAKELPAYYPAVFVVPAGEAAADFAAQKFIGTVGGQKNDMAPHFQQWVLGI